MTNEASLLSCSFLSSGPQFTFVLPEQMSVLLLWLRLQVVLLSAVGELQVGRPRRVLVEAVALDLEWPARARQLVPHLLEQALEGRVLGRDEARAQPVARLVAAPVRQEGGRQAEGREAERRGQGGRGNTQSYFRSKLSKILL